jgi:membrane-associated phospholipid phosphatase
MVTTTVYFTVFYLLKKPGMVYGMIQALTQMACLTVAYNRFTMGVHSLDQLLNGFILGMLLSWVFTSPSF